MFDYLRELSPVELRLELAEAEQQKVKTWRGSWLKKDRIQAITDELLKRGSF